MTKAKFSQLKKFFSQFPTKKLAKNTIIFNPGDKVEDVYFIKSGFVRAYTKTPFGENTLNIFKPLFMVSVMHNMVSQKNNLYIQALTPVEIYVAPKAQFTKFQKEYPEFEALITEFFVSSMLNYLTNQGNIINGNAINKVASVLLQLVHDYGDSKNNELVVNFPATHRIVANIVGLTRETTSIQMSKLQKLGVISTKRAQFTVKNIERLKSLADLGE